jgi:organic radical activating enzyme
LAQHWSRIENGLIEPPDALEIVASDHCNLTCRQCNHASPIVAKWNLDPEDAFRDLALLARWYRPRRVKVIGGEPLLNPRVGEVIAAVRKSGITPRVVLITNGVLLRRLPLDAWRSLDEIEISMYPGAGLDDELLAWAADTARATDTKLILMRLDHFRFTFSRVVNDDAGSVARIFAGCKIVSIWGCHALYRGRLYRCPQSIYIPTFAPVGAREGIALEDAPGFQERLLAFLNDDRPLASCRHCVGTNGRMMPHEMPTRTAWAADLDLPPSAILDEESLEETLRAPSEGDACRVDESAGVGRPPVEPPPPRGGMRARLWPW